MTTFRKVNLEISKLSGYSTYEVSAMYRGKLIKVTTHDSECYDWLNDDSNKEKHQQAKRVAYGLITRRYNDLCE